jgi:hypothetical protein
MSEIRKINLPLPPGCAGIPPKKVLTPCGLGCDIRPGSFDVCIGTIESPRPGVLIPRIVFYGKVRDEEDVIFLCQQYPVRCGIADCRPETTVIKRMIDRLTAMKKKFWRAQYTPNASSNIEMSVNEQEKIVTLHRTMALDTVFFAASNGMLALPQNYMEICQHKFASEMCQSTRVPVMERGEEAWHWTSGSDHAFHAVAYMIAAMTLGKLSQYHSDVITTIPGATQGSIKENSDKDDEFGCEWMDPMAGLPGVPSLDDEGRQMWSDGGMF